MRCRQGFTLLEVLVALAIVAIASAGIATALPAALAPSPVARAADAVESLLLQARRAALAGARPVVVRTDGDGRALAAPALGARVDLPRPVAMEVRGVAGWGSAAMPEGPLSAASSGAAIVFLPDGSSSGGRILLFDAATGPGGEARAVRVAWLTGRVERR